MEERPHLLLALVVGYVARVSEITQRQNRHGMHFTYSQMDVPVS